MNPSSQDLQRLSRSLQTYLQSDQNLSWIVGVTSTQLGAARQLLHDLNGYGDPARHKELSDWIQQH